MRLFKEKYDPSELRISKGNKGGGRWTNNNKPKIKDSEVNRLDPEEMSETAKKIMSINLEINGFNNCKVVGYPSHAYNCIGWAFGDNTRWWWPSFGGCFWPKKCVVEDHTVFGGMNELESFKKLFEYAGAESTMDDKPEEGFVKLAVYKGHKNITHLARLLPDGTWTSKMGDCAKVVNDEPYDLSGGAYGRVAEIIKIPTEKWAELKDLD